MNVQLSANDFTFEPQGDRSILITARGSDIDFLCQNIRLLDEQIAAANIVGLIETVPAYATLAVYYEPEVVSFVELLRQLLLFPKRQLRRQLSRSRQFELPVCYGGEFAPDLARVAKQSGLSDDEVIEVHSTVTYIVAMIGFSPGFPYLVGLPAELATPRLNSPRVAVPSGSVGIGGSQTGIYTLDTPGGWNIIGRTPIALFEPDASPVSVLAAGDTVRFHQITEPEFWRLKHELSEGASNVTHGN